MDRIRSVRRVVWVHDGDMVTVEIGRRMRGARVSRDRKKARMGLMDPERDIGGVPVTIDNTSNPWRVYLDPLQGLGAWASPFYIGESSIRSVTYFDQETPR